MNTKFHSGEIEIQNRAGVTDLAKRVSKIISNTLPHNADYFLEYQTVVIIGSIDVESNVWASAAIGAPGFIIAPDRTTLRIDISAIRDKILIENLKKNPDIGVLAIEFNSRMRLKMKGKARVEKSHIKVLIERAYGQCPKYIQARELLSLKTENEINDNSESFENLNPEIKKFISTSDTFFIATSNEKTGIDVSHRGGNPGFIEVLDTNTIVFPDYPGNNMFNTLGNIFANPHSGLLFIDFDKGDTIQLNGKATIIWDEHRVNKFSGAERIVEFQIENGIVSAGSVPRDWEYISNSPFNPDLK